MTASAGLLLLLVIGDLDDFVAHRERQRRGRLGTGGASVRPSIVQTLGCRRSSRMCRMSDSLCRWSRLSFQLGAEIEEHPEFPFVEEVRIDVVYPLLAARDFVPHRLVVVLGGQLLKEWCQPRTLLL